MSDTENESDDTYYKGPSESLCLHKVTADDRRHAGEYVSKGIRSLQRGEEQKAKRYLNKACRLDPGNKNAQKLLRQINYKFEDYLEEEYVEYIVQSGDSLSNIAKKFMKDHLEFYILAKYNNIKNPNRLTVGQVIKIPKKKLDISKASINCLQGRGQPPKQGQEGKEPHFFMPEYKAAKQLYEADKYKEAINLLQGIQGKDAGGVKARELLVIVYSDYARKLVDKGELVKAGFFLQKAVVLRPKDKALQKRLKGIEDRLAVPRLYKKGIKAMDRGQLDKAYNAFLQLLELQQDHVKGREQLTKLRPELIDFYHKKAMIAYRRQELEVAIDAWDKVLKLDPKHELARLNRARALELKERLKKLETEKK